MIDKNNMKEIEEKMKNGDLSFGEICELMHMFKELKSFQKEIEAEETETKNTNLSLGLGLLALGLSIINFVLLLI